VESAEIQIGHSTKGTVNLITLLKQKFRKVRRRPPRDACYQGLSQLTSFNPGLPKGSFFYRPSIRLRTQQSTQTRMGQLGLPFHLGELQPF
jgi:hypothetical protein